MSKIVPDSGKVICRYRLYEFVNYYSLTLFYSLTIIEYNFMVS